MQFNFGSKQCFTIRQKVYIMLFAERKKATLTKSEPEIHINQFQKWFQLTTYDPMQLQL